MANIPSGDMTFDNAKSIKLCKQYTKANVYGYHKNRHTHTHQKENLKPNK